MRLETGDSRPGAGGEASQVSTPQSQVFAVAVVIIGAGAGKRFGGPKAEARLPDGRRFVDAIAGTARDAGLKPVVAVLPPGIAVPDGVRGVVNPNPESEQVVSARLGLALLSNSSAIGALLWPVDHPHVTLESVLAVIDGAKRTAAPIVVPVSGGKRGHPVFFHRDTWREVLTVATGGARAVVRDYGAQVIEVTVVDEGVLRNVNEPGA